jgi:inhibitor of cysteine peptidase
MVKTKTAVFAVIVILAVLLSVAGCLDRSFNRNNDDSTVQVSPGDTVTIALGENPSTGFIWNATSSGDLTITGKEFTSGNPVGEMMGMVGVGGSVSWHVIIGRDPVQTFSAVLRRPGDPENRTMGTYSLTFMTS